MKRVIATVVGRLAVWVGATLTVVCVASDTVLAQNTAQNPKLTSSGRPGKGQAWGYLGDGSGVMDAKPPLKFDGTKPVWKTPLPAYGHSTPIVVNGKVLVTCEPSASCPWPQLICVNDKDGVIQWQAPLNHLPATALTADQQKQAQSHWAEVWRKLLLFIKTRNALAADPAKKAELDALKMDWSDLGPLGDKHSPLSKATLTMDTWGLWGKYGPYMMGESFPTPTTDGAHVYAVTAFGGFFCFDLNGKLEWMKHYPGQPGEYCRNGRSPIIYRDLLLCDTTAMMRAIDRKTGELKWSAPVDGGAYITPTVINPVGGDVVLCANGEAFSLPDGKKLKVNGVSSFGCVAITRQDQPDVVLFLGGDEHGGWAKENPPPPMMVRFSRTGDKLDAQVLWDGKAITRGGGQQAGVAMYGNKVYHRFAGIFDATNGQWLVRCGKGPGWPRAVPNTGHLLYVANGHVFGMQQETPNREGKGTTALHYQVSTVDGQPVADSAIPGEYTYSCSFTLSGNRAYIRSQDHLLCFQGQGEPR